jgi:multicomponent Na+:H+ antiporter subunit D
LSKSPISARRRTADRCEAPLALLLPAWLLVLATIWFGIDTSLTVGSALDAAQQLVRTGR